VIPALFRKALGIAAGDELILRLKDNELCITTKQRHIQRPQEGTRGYVESGRSSAEELLAESRREAERE
jgi:bifunctional DNA-binding transcriptional regulator/antitoxin component of YhaV-PrlF toxin-antitoxin module